MGIAMLHFEGESQNAAQRRAGRGVRLLAVLLAALVLMVVACAIVYAVNASTEMVSFAAQDDAAYLEEQESSEPHVTSASTQVTDLVALMGLSRDAAIAAVGHGAWEQGGDSLGSMDFSNEVVLLLTDEPGDALSGTPTVRLGLNDEGIVEGASYEAPLTLMGYGQLSFSSAVVDFHVVEHMLARAGLYVPLGSVELPDSSAYSTYESDRKTLSSEKYTFSGTAETGNAAYSWAVTLDYDYDQANETGDLANTVKRVSVEVRPA